jgi:hypothetical protein
MNLFIPLLIMIAALAVAWGFGWLARGKSDAVRWSLAILGVALVFTLPLVYEAAAFDGSCYADDGAVQSCTLSEMLWGSFGRGFAYTIPPAVFWVAAFVISAKMPR